MTYNLNLKPDNDAIRQCGCVVSRFYMQKHLTTKRSMNKEMVRVGLVRRMLKENVEKDNHYVEKDPSL